MDYDALVLHGWVFDSAKPFDELKERFGWDGGTETMAIADDGDGGFVCGLVVHWSSPQSALGFNMSKSIFAKVKRQLKGRNPLTIAARIEGAVRDAAPRFWFCVADGQPATKLVALAGRQQVELARLPGDRRACAFDPGARAMKAAAPSLFAAGRDLKDVFVRVVRA